MDSYFRPLKALKSEIVIERSRFIGLAYPIESEDEAISILSSLKKEYYDASHICYAYVADERCGRVRFSDSGEPQGTAGQPILTIISSGNFRKTLVAVVRYFGGIKLGTGGLTRAYGECAKTVLNSVEPAKWVLCVNYNISVSYSDFSVLEGRLKSQGYSILRTEYADEVKLLVASEDRGLDPTSLVYDISKGDGKVSRGEEGYIQILNHKN